MSFRKALEQKLYGLQADITIRLACWRRVEAIPNPTPPLHMGLLIKPAPALVMGVGWVEVWMLHNRPDTF